MLYKNAKQMKNRNRCIKTKTLRYKSWQLLTRFVDIKIKLSTNCMANVKINITKPNSASNKSAKPSYKVWLNKMSLFVRSAKWRGRRSIITNKR